MLTDQDLQQLKSKGISEEKLNAQLASFEKGFPFLKLYAPASAGQGIHILNDEDKKTFLKTWDKYLNSEHKIVKFVPASGAASRMFKDLFEFLDGVDEEPNNEFTKLFF